MPGSHCSVIRCSNGTRGLRKWMEEFCDIHRCRKGTSRCVCDPPYVLVPFPTARKDPGRRAEWAKLLNRKDIKTGQSWVPVKNSRVCSKHFVDGAPSASFPNPTLDLGYPEPSTITQGKWVRPRRPVADKALKMQRRQKLIFQSSITEDAEIQGPSKEDVPQTGGSDLGTQPHVDHSYTKTTKCNCQSSCTCVTTAWFSKRIIQLANKMKILETKSDESYCSSILADVENRGHFTERCLSDDRSVSLNTGLPDRETFHKLLQVLTPRAAKMRSWDGTQRVISTKMGKDAQSEGRELSVKAEFLMVLMKLRLGRADDILARMFSVSESCCSSTVTAWIKFLGVQLSGLVIWPDKDSIRSMLPATVAEEYPDLRCILDRCETFIDRPQDLKLQAATWSEEKKHNTLKYLVGIAPNGHISFMSKAMGGRTTDRQMVQQSGILDLVEPRDLIMADCGFPIQEDLLFKKAALVKPPPSSGLEQICPQSVARTQRVADVGDRVERGINRLKGFQILSTTLPETTTRLFDDILIVCAALCNLLPPLTLTSHTWTKS